MNCTVRELEIGHEYVFVSADDPEQLGMEVYHGTLVEIHDGETILVAKFKLREFAGEKYDSVYLTKIVKNSYCRSSDKDPLTKMITLDAMDVDVNDRKDARIHQIFHRWKQSYDKDGNPNGKFYWPRGFFIGYDFDDLINVYEAFLNKSLAEHKAQIDKDIELYEYHKITYPMQVMILKKMKQ